MSSIKILKVIIGEDSYPIKVPADMLEEGESFFAKVDSDMDRGWQMSRLWVEHPNTVQRCQILADRMLTALHASNHQMVGLSAAYILKRLLDVECVDMDTTGDMTQTRFEVNGKWIPSD
ncbi:MAG: hypothetical protein GDA45_02265 [Chromatiales bacterium]|nr:hypothetical protein [Chromatiales bacterium]